MFTPGKIYKRRSLHKKYGGQWQGGISTPAKYPFIFIFTGPSGHAYGYGFDGWNTKEFYNYTGEGQLGNMKFIKGNKAIRDHVKDNKKLFLFEQTSSGNVKFVREMEYVDYKIKKGPDLKKNIRDVIVFELSPSIKQQDLKKKKMAFLLATDNWDKMDVYEAFLTKHDHFAWRMGGQYSSEYLSQIQYPINVYFFHENLIKFRAKCKNIVMEQSWSLKDIPPQYREDNPSYTMYLEFTKLERVPETHISEFPKWGNPKKYFDRGNLGLLRAIDVFEKKNFFPVEIDADIGYTEDDEGFAEGKRALKKHLTSERSQKLKIAAKKRMLHKIGKLKCEACGFVFEDKYGDLGKNYIEVHHLKPISEIKEGKKTKLSDVSLVCSNCHRMLHRKRPWIALKDLKNILIHK